MAEPDGGTREYRITVVDADGVPIPDCTVEITIAPGAITWPGGDGGEPR